MRKLQTCVAVSSGIGRTFLDLLLSISPYFESYKTGSNLVGFDFTDMYWKALFWIYMSSIGLIFGELPPPCDSGELSNEFQLTEIQFFKLQKYIARVGKVAYCILFRWPLQDCTKTAKLSWINH